MYAYFYPSGEFLEFIKTLENAQQTGYDEQNNSWIPVGSVEGGLPTIAYGHKVRKDELDTMRNGIADEQAHDLLLADIEDAYLAVINYVTNHLGDHTLNVKQTEMLTEFAFNLGTLRGFPKFTQAVVDNDWETAQQEYKRYFTDADGNRHELMRRNELFAKRYFVD